MTHIAPHAPHRFASRLARAKQAADDRRLFRRFEGVGLMVRMGENLVEVADISVGGLRVPRQNVGKGKTLTLHLIPRDGSKLALNESIRAEAEVVGSCERWTHLRFQSVTYSLAKTIVRHIARVTGAQPYHFR